MTEFNIAASPISVHAPRCIVRIAETAEEDQAALEACARFAFIDDDAPLLTHPDGPELYVRRADMYRLTERLQRCSRDEALNLAKRDGFTELETTALLYARDSLLLSEDEKDRACDLHDAWLDLSAVACTTTWREFALVCFADGCIESALH